MRLHESQAGSEYQDMLVLGADDTGRAKVGDMPNAVVLAAQSIAQAIVYAALIIREGMNTRD